MSSFVGYIALVITLFLQTIYNALIMKISNRFLIFNSSFNTIDDAKIIYLIIKQ